MGATWSEVVAALDITPNDARAMLRAWATGQDNLHEGAVQANCERPFGLDADQHAAVIALYELGDEETTSVVTR